MGRGRIYKQLTALGFNSFNGHVDVILKPNRGFWQTHGAAYRAHKALVAAGLPALSLHCLRRSFGTLAEWVECPAGISAQIMGHKPSATAEKHYRRRPLDLLRSWHVKIEAWVLEHAGIEQLDVDEKPGLLSSQKYRLQKDA